VTKAGDTYVDQDIREWWIVVDWGWMWWTVDCGRVCIDCIKRIFNVFKLRYAAITTWWYVCVCVCVCVCLCVWCSGYNCSSWNGV